ncbi:hypothetical protein QJQ45_006439 [Haematococcus lacustris]|nr:hypothetical protein QJQ45_006439 [Haematococcus lacustris]
MAKDPGKKQKVSRSPQGKQRQERRDGWTTRRRQVIKVPEGAVLRGCKKTRRKLREHLRLRAEMHSQLRVIASLLVLRIFLTCLVGYPTPGFPSAPQPPAVQPPQPPDAPPLPPLPPRAPAQATPAQPASMECDTDSDSESDCDSEPEPQSDWESESEPEPVTQPPPRRCRAGGTPPGAPSLEPGAWPAGAGPDVVPCSGPPQAPTGPTQQPGSHTDSSLRARASTPQPAKRTKRTKAEPAAEPTKGKGKGKAAKAKPAPQPGRWLDRDCNAALNMQRIGESRLHLKLLLNLRLNLFLNPCLTLRQDLGLDLWLMKAATARSATASCRVMLGQAAFSLVVDNARQSAKGNVLGTAQLAGIMAAKQTSALIPLCHNIPLSKVGVEFELDPSRHAVHISAQALTVSNTGVEMEALTAASVAALTVYDMCKAVSKDIEITALRLEAKSGGRSGSFRRTIGVGIDPGVTQAVSAASGVWDPQSGQLMADQLRRWKLTKGQVKHASGLNNARRDTERWLAPIKPHLQHLAAASSAGTSLEANLKHITVTLATWDAVWEVYLDPKWSRQRLRLYGAQDRALEQFLKKLEEEVAEVSMERHGHAKQLVVFFGAATIGTGGEWGADAVLRACRKVVCRPRGADQRRGRVVLVDEHRTSRVSSAVNGQQPCEVELDKLSATRPAGWKPPTGQVEPRLVRPAWSQECGQPVRGLMWCPVVTPRKPPQAPRSSQEATPTAASEPGPSTPLPAKRSKRTKAEPAVEPTKGKGKGKAAKAKPAPQPGRWLDRDCNAALNMQRIGESRWRPLELCYWPDQGALPAKGKEYPGLGYNRLRDKPPKAQQQQQQPARALAIVDALVEQYPDVPDRESPKRGPAAAPTTPPPAQTATVCGASEQPSCSNGFLDVSSDESDGSSDSSDSDEEYADQATPIVKDLRDLYKLSYLQHMSAQQRP